MEAQTALIRTDSRVELYSEASVYLYLAVVVNPRYTEHDLSFRLYDTVKNACIDEILSLLCNGLKCFENLCNSLNELRLAGISFLNCFQKIDEILIF